MQILLNPNAFRLKYRYMKHETLFRKLAEIFLAENQKLNLSSFKTTSEVYEKHILDSLEATKAFPEVFNNARCLIDIGTGGGFPGLPLLIENPNIEVTFMDATRKKLDAIERMTDTIKLSVNYKWKTLWGRAE